METSFSSLSINNERSRPPPILGTNVYRFQVNSSKDVRVFKYIVTCNRTVITDTGAAKVPIKAAGADAIRLIRSRIIRRALEIIGNENREKTIIYDGFNIIYSNAVIIEHDLTKEIPVSALNLTDDDKRIVLKDSTTLSITIKGDGGLNDLKGKIKDCDVDSDELAIVHFFSNLVRSAAPESQFIALRAGRLIDISTLKSIGSAMERGKGVKIGTKLIGLKVQEELSVAIDIDSKEGTFFKPQKLLKTVVEYFNQHSEQDLRRRFNDSYAVRQIERFIRDLTVRVEVSEKIVCISGIKWERDGDGRQIAASRDPSGMLIVVEHNLNGEGTITPNYYSLDKLHILPYTRVPLAKQDFAKISRPPSLAPNVRYDMIDKARKDIRIDHQNANLKGFEIEISNKPVCPLYKILPPPKISAMRNNQKIDVAVDTNKHGYNSNQFQFVQSAHIDCLHVVYDKRERYLNDEDTASRFFNALGKVCMAKGITFSHTKFEGMDPGERLEELERKLRKLASQRDYETNKNGKVPIVLVVCVGFQAEHDCLKYLEYESQVLTQHVMGNTVKRILRNNNVLKNETLHNIVKKINEKCGGSNLEVESPPECASIFPSSVRGTIDPASLIIGMDVCHGEPLSKHLLMRGVLPDPSIIGISSNAQTRNPKMFTGDFIATQGRREAVPNSVMSDYGQFLVKQFQKNHGRLPSNIILIRDGVSRSQYEMARGEFSALMEGARITAGANFKPRELLIVVTKEHNMRLFDKQGGKVCNPQAGTVVDTHIVSPFYPEFLIIPHDAFYGTAKVILATILIDGEKKLEKYSHDDLKEIEFFIHTLCFCHGISDNPSGLPEPVSVGHDLAERGSNIAKERRFRTGERLSVDQLKGWLKTRETLFEGVKFTA